MEITAWSLSSAFRKSVSSLLLSESLSIQSPRELIITVRHSHSYSLLNQDDEVVACQATLSLPVQINFLKQRVSFRNLFRNSDQISNPRTRSTTSPKSKKNRQWISKIRFCVIQIKNPCFFQRIAYLSCVIQHISSSLTRHYK